MEAILYEDNHLLVVNKRAGEIVQGDKTGDEPLVERLKRYLKKKYAKPGEVFLGVVHRLDRPVSGVCVFARTSKALARMNEMFARKGEELSKSYLAIVPRDDKYIGHNTKLEHYVFRNAKQNKSYAYTTQIPNAKKAVLDFDVVQVMDRYMLVEIHLHTGRHHQIRCQLAKVGLPIRGDLKYGAPRSMPDGRICLHANRLEFIHPVRKERIIIEAPVPDNFNL